MRFIKQNIAVTCLLALCINAIAQKQANIWYFGTMAGLDFNSGAPVALTDGQMSTSEGCSSISDKNGHLLFYTDGGQIWDAHHHVMPNGSGLLGCSSSTQSAMIAPVLGSCHQYYVFTSDGSTCSTWFGLNYSIVDMTLAGNGTSGSPMGDVTAVKNVNLIDHTEEKIAGARHANGSDYWIITKRDTDIYAFRVTCEGVDSTPVISSFIRDYQPEGVGYLTASADGKSIVEANLINDDPFAPSACYLYDFDPSTGIATHTATFGPDAAYGIAYSPNDSLIYITGAGTNKIYQYERYASNIIASEVSYSTTNLHNGMQLGPDGKIYVTDFQVNTLTTINNPNSKTTPNITDGNIALSSGVSQLGLPNIFFGAFKHSATAFTYSVTCSEKPVTFTLSYHCSIDSVSWNFGDPLSGASNRSGDLDPSHLYSSPGTYDVEAIIYKCSDADTLVGILTNNSCVVESSITPNVFSPNNDGKNDVFTIKLTGATKLHARIFDRWGQVIYEWDDLSGGWNGKTASGKPAPDGTYYYTVEATYSSHSEKSTGFLMLTN